MKNIVLLTSVLSLSFVSCQNPNENKDQELSEKTIAIHDEIMPQISSFDKTTLVIDSILTNLQNIKAQNKELDTTNIRVELTQLKDSLDAATDHMMDWMKEYDPANQAIEYQEFEFEKISKMKSQFDRAHSLIDKNLAPFNQ